MPFKLRFNIFSFSIGQRILGPDNHPCEVVGFKHRDSSGKKPKFAFPSHRVSMQVCFDGEKEITSISKKRCFRFRPMDLKELTPLEQLVFTISPIRGRSLSAADIFEYTAPLTGLSYSELRAGLTSLWRQGRVARTKQGSRSFRYKIPY